MDLDVLAIKNSSWTWDRLRESRKLGFQLGEESITDFVVLNLKKWGQGKLAIDTFTRRQESVNGSDWEWWFTGPSGRWLGMRVQAKVLNLKTEKFEHLHYINRLGAQVDLLISDAARNSLVPLYCMYSNWDITKYQAKWKCQTYSPSVRHYGNSILNPIDVKQLQANKETRLSEIISKLQPMHCIFCCRGFGGADLPERALRYINGTGLRPENLDPQEFLKSSAPHYVYQLLERALDGDFADLHDDRLRRVTVIRELEGGER